ncbi:MAG: hypothetical protein FJW86_05945 [Actinobacteria bacterium]|nr:hypothetical protein [Actinomycetota bacterium]
MLAETIETLASELVTVLNAALTGERPLDRRALVVILGEMERVHATLRDVRRCEGRNWSTPFAAVIGQVLDAVAAGSADLPAQDLQILVEIGLRTGAFVDAPPEREAQLVDVLREKLAQAQAAGDARAAEAVALTAAVLGQGDLAAEALELERSLR